MIHVTMRKEEEFREAINTIRGSVRKIITSDSWETDKFSRETAHFSLNSIVFYNFRLKGHSSVIDLLKDVYWKKSYLRQNNAQIIAN